MARFRHGVKWTLVTSLFAQGSILLANVVIARILGSHAFGQFGIIQNTVVTVAGVAQAGTGISVTKYAAEFRSVNKVRAGRILALCSVVTVITGVLAALLTVAAAGWMAADVLKQPALTHALIIASVAIAFSVLSGNQASSLAGLEGYRAASLAAGLQGICFLVCVGGGAAIQGLTGGIIGLAISAAAGWYVYHWALRRETAAQNIESTFRGCWSERKELIRFVIPAALNGLSTMPALWLANTFLVRQEDGYVQMGLYSAAASLKSAVTFLPMLFNRIGTSLLNNERGRRRNDSYARLFWSNLALSGAFAVAGAAAVCLVGRPLLKAFGPNFVLAYPTLVLLMVCAVLEIITGAAYQVITSEGRMWLSLFAVSLPRDILIAGSAWILTPRYGAAGLGLAYCIGWFVCAIVVSCTVSRAGFGVGLGTAGRPGAAPTMTY